MTHDDKIALAQVLTLASWFITIAIIATCVKTRCSFLGISEWLYSIFSHHDCDGFLIRDWICLSLWVAFTYGAIAYLYMEESPNFKTRTKIFTYWVGFMVFAMLLEFAMALSLPINFLVAVCGITFEYVYTQQPLKAKEGSGKLSSHYNQSNPCTQVQITVQDTRIQVTQRLSI